MRRKLALIEGSTVRSWRHILGSVNRKRGIGLYENVKSLLIVFEYANIIGHMQVLLKEK